MSADKPPTHAKVNRAASNSHPTKNHSPSSSLAQTPEPPRKSFSIKESAMFSSPGLPVEWSMTPLSGASNTPSVFWDQKSFWSPVMKTVALSKPPCRAVRFLAIFPPSSN